MYEKLQTFLKTTIIGGMLVMLPLILLIKISVWLFNFLQAQLQPLASVVSKWLDWPAVYADVIALVLVMAICFWVGLFARIKFGATFWLQVEKFTLAKIPGYSLLKSMVGTFSGSGKQSFTRAVLVRPWGDETYLTGFITDTASNGYVCVFVPTSPTPTTGLVMHVPKDRVIEINEFSGLAFKTVLSCGAGAAQMVDRIPDILVESGAQK